jgi:hypothetical protein
MEAVAWTWPASNSGDPLSLCTVDYSFGFTTQSGIVLRIECPFTYRTSRGETILLDPENDPAQLGPVLSVVRSAVLNAFADEAGALHLDFADGSAIEVPSNDQFEAWTIAGNDGLLLVSLPGQGIAKWGTGTSI